MYNYYAEAFNKNTNDWISYINKSYLEVNTPTIKIFRLDKTATHIDSLYGEEEDTRIYLPPIEIHALYLDSLFSGIMGAQLYAEQDSKEMIFVTNFEDMVQKIVEAKKRKIVSIFISYSGTEAVTSSKENDSFTINKNGSPFISFDLNSANYNTAKKLTAAIIAADNSFTVSIEGENDLSVNIVNYDITDFTGARLEIYVQDTTYANVSDVFEMGDVILTNKWKLYQVNNANITGNFGWDFVTYSLTCGLANIDQASLPGDYKSQIVQHRYGLSDKINME